MKLGDMVTWNARFGVYFPLDIGLILEHIPFESRGDDPFPHWKVLFPDRGVLRCRESDLLVISETR